MASTEGRRPAARRWNLGKDLPETEPKVAPPVPPPPAAEKTPLPARPATTTPPPGESSAGYATSESSAPQPLPGRPAPPPRTFREALNHPLTLIIVGLGLSALVMMFLLDIGGGPGRRRAELPKSSGEFVAAYLSGEGAKAGLPAGVSQPAESTAMRDARTLMAAGQILEAVAAFREAQGRDAGLGSDRFDFVPPAIMQAPLPAGTEQEVQIARLIREQAADQAWSQGRSAVDRAAEGGLTVEELRGLATRLTTEGMAVVERSGGESALAGLPAARGAGNRLALIESAIGETRISELLRGLFDREFAESVIGVRATYFAPVARTPGP